VPAALSWTEGLWRFYDNGQPPTALAPPQYVKYNKGNAGFTAYLNGSSTGGSGVTVGGFTKVVDGVSTGPSNIANFYYSSTAGIAEVLVGGSDLWLDMWNSEDTAPAYLFYEYDDTTLAGQKCIAGYCKSRPIWFMVR
jgi:hypothetical protein